MGVTWLTAILDSPAPVAAASEAFWARVTGWTVSQRRGDHDQFATLDPPDGDAFLRLQVVDEPPTGMMHLDLHTDDVGGLAATAERLGAVRVAEPEGYPVHRTPGGVTFCVVSHRGAVRPAPASWPAGHSLVDQVCLDLPREGYEDEVRLWAELLAWPRQPGGTPEFERLLPPVGQPLQILVQRLAEQDGPARMHLDLSADDVAAEVGRHLDLGARGVRLERHWTTLMDPAGRVYCVTSRSPTTGRLP
jgi:hypothetical protein